MAGISMKTVDELPPEVTRRGPRASLARDAVEMALKDAGKYVEITAPTAEELDKFYKAMIQWRNRHRDEVNVGIRKSGPAVYIWVDPKRIRSASRREEGQSASPARAESSRAEERKAQGQ